MSGYSPHKGEKMKIATRLGGYVLIFSVIRLE